MKKSSYLTVLVAVLGLFVLGCGKSSNPVEVSLSEQSEKSVLNSTFLSKTGEAPPPDLVIVPGVGTFWPFTGTNFSGIRQDPINLVFIGKADPRALRAALLLLDGDRTAFGFPNAFPFNLTWQDAIGGVQTAFANPDGWVGNAVQLELGTFETARFHMRLFDVGDFTLAGCHFEVLIPNTTDHQVLNWELAEQLIVADFLRSGLLAGLPIPTGIINDEDFKGKPSDGKATILNLAESEEGEVIVATQEFVINFDQTIPKPLCASGLFDFLLVQGPVNLRQKVILTPSGNFISQFHARGHLDVTPINPPGEPYRALVNEHHKGIVTDNVTLASSFRMFLELPPIGPFRGQLLVRLNVGPGESNQFSLEVKCLP